MSPSEFYEKVTLCLLLCNGWMTSGLRPIQHNADVGGVWSSLHQVALGIDGVLENKDSFVPKARRPVKTQGLTLNKPFTFGELFTAMCDRVGLLAIDEGDHFHVQPKIP